MKKISVLVVMVFLLCGCRNFMFSHNAYQVADGKVARFGTPEFNILFVRGTLTTIIGRENVEAVVETNNGDAVARPTGTFRGLTTARFRTGPQMTGYLKDVAKHDPVTARKYVEQMPELNKAQWDVKQETPVDVSPVQSAPLPSVADKVKSIAEPFTCGGDCELVDLSRNDSIAYQTAVAAKLLTYADDTTKFDGEESTLKHSLESFLTRMKQLLAKGKSKTQMRVKAATVKGGHLIYIRYIMTEPDGNEFETNCPECVLLED